MALQHIPHPDAVWIPAAKIDEHLRNIGLSGVGRQSIARISLNWFEKALYEISATPKGCFKQAWAMRLMRSGSRCQLPRGFFKGRKKPIFVGPQ